MSIDQHTIYWLLYRGLRHKCGMYRRRREETAFRTWHRTNPRPSGGHICWICTHPIAVQADFSFDHVIPKDAIYTYGLASWLIFDSRNLQPAHKRCNSSRSNKQPSYDDLARIPNVSSALLVEYQRWKMLQGVERRRKQKAAPSVAAKYLERAGVGQV